MLPMAASGRRDKIGGAGDRRGGISKSVRSCGQLLFALGFPPRGINCIYAIFIDNYRVKQYDASAMTRSEANVRAGAKLRGIRVRLGLSVRDVERLSIELAENRHNPYLAFSKTWITDIEKGRFVPGRFKMASLAEIYGMELVEIHKLYGVPPAVISPRSVRYSGHRRRICLCRANN